MYVYTSIFINIYRYIHTCTYVSPCIHIEGYGNHEATSVNVIFRFARYLIDLCSFLYISVVHDIYMSLHIHMQYIHVHIYVHIYV